MGPVTRRLNALWLRETRLPLHPPARSDQLAAKMFVKVKEPLNIGRRALPPGIYVLRPSGAGEDPNSAQILNQDQTELLATIRDPRDH